MPKKINATIGTVKCPFGDHLADVRKYKERVKLDEQVGGRRRYAGTLYLYCNYGCGRITSQNQDWILENATITGETPAPDTSLEASVGIGPAADAAPVPSTGDDPIAEPPVLAPAPEPAPEPAKESISEKLDKWLL